MTNYPEHVSVVTGAAGGMGSAIARAFAAEGRALVLSDLHAEPLGRLGIAAGSSASPSRRPDC